MKSGNGCPIAGVFFVGVNPITAVPTRPIFGGEARNPGNRLEVARLAVRLPSPRLQDGLVLVDTPGLGALAIAGAAETLAYLPQCDLGVSLISSVKPVNDEDLKPTFPFSTPLMNLWIDFIINIHTGLNATKTLRRSNPVGEKQNQPFQLSFNTSLKIDFHGSRVTSDGGLILVRELDERLGFGAPIT